MKSNLSKAHDELCGLLQKKLPSEAILRVIYHLKGQLSTPLFSNTISSSTFSRNVKDGLRISAVGKATDIIADLENDAVTDAWLDEVCEQPRLGGAPKAIELIDGISSHSNSAENNVSGLADQLVIVAKLFPLTPIAEIVQRACQPGSVSQDQLLLMMKWYESHGVPEEIERYNIAKKDVLQAITTDSAQSKARSILRLAINDQKVLATSCTLFLSDPHNSSNFMLALQEGALYPETLSEWFATGVAEEVVQFDKGDDFARESNSLPNCRQDPCPYDDNLEEPFRTRIKKLIEEEPLFGSYRERERIRMFSVISGTGKFGTRFVVCFNFDYSIRAQNECKLRIQQTKHELSTIVDCFSENLQFSSRLETPASSLWTRAGTYPTFPSDLHKAVRHILEEGRAILHNDNASDDTFVSLHLYNNDTHVLHYFDSVGIALRTGECWTQDVASGEGVLSWVALRRQSILINDFRNSDFKRIYRICSSNTMLSELAVPLLDPDGHVVGVLNAEAERPFAFSEKHARLFTCLASRLSELRRYYEVVRRQQVDQLNLKLWSKMYDPEINTFHVRSVWIQTVCELLQADFAHLLLENESSTAFCSVAAYDAETKATKDHPRISQPRVDSDDELGWTNYVARTKLPVWISNISSLEKFNVAFWHEENFQWENATGENESQRQRLPNTLNASVIPEGVICELGFPIPNVDGQRAVAWIKYRRACEPNENFLPTIRTPIALGVTLERVRIYTPDEESVDVIAPMKSILNRLYELPGPDPASDRKRA